MWKYVLMSLAFLFCMCEFPQMGVDLDQDPDPYRIIRIHNYSTISGVNVTLEQYNSYAQEDDSFTKMYYLCECPTPGTSISVWDFIYRNAAWWSIESVADSFPFATHGHVYLTCSKEVHIYCEFQDSAWQWEVIWSDL